MEKIKNFENYLVTRDGQVWSNYSRKYLKQIPNKDGYLEVCLRNKEVQRNFRVHRLVAEAYLENPNKLPIVHHKDNDKQNNCVENLKWCDVSYNTKEAYKAGALSQKGEKNNACKYPDEVVRSIIDGYRGGSIAEYARSLGIEYSVVYSYLKRLRRS